MSKKQKIFICYKKINTCRGFKKFLLLGLLFIISSFTLAFSQGKKPFYIGVDFTSSNAAVRFPDEASESYIGAHNGLFFGKHLGIFRFYASVRPTTKYNNATITNDDTGPNPDNPESTKYSLELSKTIIGSDLLFSKYDSSWFIGLGVQSIDAKVIGEFENLVTDEIEIELKGSTNFWRLGYTWTYIEWSYTNSVGKIIEESNFYEPPADDVVIGDYELSQLHSFQITAKYNF